MLYTLRVRAFWLITFGAGFNLGEYNIQGHTHHPTKSAHEHNGERIGLRTPYFVLFFSPSVLINTCTHHILTLTHIHTPTHTHKSIGMV